MKRSLLFLPVLLTSAVGDAPAARTPVPSPTPNAPAWRCAADPLDATAATQRMKWAMACSFIPGVPGSSAVQSPASPVPPPPGPTYPIFESISVVGGTQLIPLPTLPSNGCSLFAKNATTGNYVRWPGNVYMVGYCGAIP
jgi:hypothetical protein